jgi:hypothetical protein
MEVLNNLNFLLDVYRRELLNLAINNIKVESRIQVVEVEIEGIRLFIDINNKVYMESDKKLAGKTFGKEIGYLKDRTIYIN